MKRIIISIVFLFSVYQFTNAQEVLFSKTADFIQESTYSRFYNTGLRYYNATNTGKTDFNYWWNAHGIDALLDGYNRSRSLVLRSRMKALLGGIYGRNGGQYPTWFYDDMAWLGLSTLRAYECTNDVEYLNAANSVWKDMKTGQHPEFGGAIQWNKEAVYSMNACTNGPAMILACRMYRIQGNQADLTTAVNIYNWMKTALVNPTTGEVWDNYNSNTGVTNKDWIFSYNQGTWIGACFELYKATGDSIYLENALKTARTAIKNQTGGILYPRSGGGDGGLFHGIFIRYLAQFARESDLPASVKFELTRLLRSSAVILRDRGINYELGILSPQWGVAPETTTDYSSQLSGLMLLEAAASLDQAFLYTRDDFGGKESRISARTYSSSTLIALGMDNKNLSSLTVPPGFSLTVFDADSCKGDSSVFSSNQRKLSDWDNRTVSIRLVADTSLYSRKTTLTGGIVTLATECNYAGFTASCPAGEYTWADLSRSGIYGRELRSVKVPEGYQLTLYEQDLFKGDSLVILGDSSCLNDWSDRTVSLKIVPHGLGNMAGIYKFQNRLSKLYMEVTASGTNDGANVQQGKPGVGLNQQFRLEDRGNGLYRILAMHSGMPIEVGSSGLTDGSNIQQSSWLGGDNQLFILLNGNPGYYKLAALHSGKVAEIQNIIAGANVRQWENTNQMDGQWILSKITTEAETLRPGNTHKLFPNPLLTNNELQLALPGNEEGLNTLVRMYNLTGSMVMEQNIMNSGKLRHDKLYPGTYVVSIRNSRQTSMSRLIVQ